MDEILQTCFIIMTSLAAVPIASRVFVFEWLGKGRKVKTIPRHKPKKKEPKTISRPYYFINTSCCDLSV